MSACCNKIQNRAMRYYLGLYTKAPITGMQECMGWILSKYRRYFNLFSYWNYLIRRQYINQKQFFFRDLVKENNNWSLVIKI